MINLEKVKKCPSVRNEMKTSGSLNFYTDTRKYIHPGAFVAIPGMKVNPLDLINDLLVKGCSLVFFQENPTNLNKAQELKKQFPKVEFVAVADSVTFLQELTRQHIIDWKNQRSTNVVFAISGSNGKTTHKEMLSFILKEAMPGKVVATEKNNNNHLGVPLTLLNVTDQTEIVVLELGSNHPGEIKVLCDIAQPNAGLTTNIGATHLEFFESEEKVFLEEAFLYYAVKEITHGKGFYLINIDDPFLKSLQSTPGSIRYGEGKEADAKVSYLANGAQIHYKDVTLIAQNDHITGRHNKLNLITCLFIATNFFPANKSMLIEACKNFRPTKNRSEWIQFENKSVYLDAYNANPSSMKAALEGFKESVFAQGFSMNDACVVLGDMYELGDATPQYHQDIGEFVQKLGFKNVYFVGQFASHYLKGFSAGHAKSSSADFKSEYRNECLKKFPIHFIKGSRGIKLEYLLDIV